MSDVGTDLARLRAEFASEVLARSRVESPLVAQALRDVDRHLFLPELPVEQAYTDEAIVTMRDADGVPVSSSSQPAMMVLMLDQLGPVPGHRILEIGAGTGYNAALMRHAVGDGGHVVTVDIEPEAVDRAREALAAVGYPDVTVVCADGADGYPAGAPYDGLIATVGISDLAPRWLNQLAPQATLVAPLDLGGMQCSVAFQRSSDGEWRSRSVIPCGFIRMRGALAGAERVVSLTPRLRLLMPDGRALTSRAGEFADVLAGPGTARVPTGTAAGEAALTGLGLWLGLREPRFCGLSEEVPPTGKGLLSAMPGRLSGFRTTAGLTDGGTSIAILLLDDGGELTAVGYGVAGQALAEALAAEVYAWDTAGRPGPGQLRVTAWPRPLEPVPGDLLLERPWTRFTVSFAA